VLFVLSALEAFENVCAHLKRRVKQRLDSSHAHCQQQAAKLTQVTRTKKKTLLERRRTMLALRDEVQAVLEALKLSEAYETKTKELSSEQVDIEVNIVHLITMKEEMQERNGATRCYGWSECLMCMNTLMCCHAH
jgi:uncharacterized protein YciW